MIKKMILFLQSEPIHLCVVSIAGALLSAGLVYLFKFGNWLFVWLFIGFLALYFLSYFFLRLIDPLLRADRAMKFSGDVVRKTEIYFDRMLPLLRKSLPAIIYRFVPLTGRTDEDEKRFRTLEGDALWFSRADKVNDIFEGLGVYYSQGSRFDELLAAYADFESRQAAFQAYFLEGRRDFALSCFTRDCFDVNMWSRYASDHRGFCVAYEVVSTDTLYPVQYNAEKVDVGPMLESLQRDLVRGDLPNPDYERTLKKLHLAWCTVKSDRSQAEDEIRAILPIRIAPHAGTNRPCSEAGLKIEGIYLGCACSPLHKARLQSIAKSFGVFCREVEPDYLSKRFTMKEGSASPSPASPSSP